MSKNEDLIEGFESMSISSKNTFSPPNKAFFQLPQNQYQSSDDFLRPIAVKSSKWSQNKVNLSSLANSKLSHLKNDNNIGKKTTILPPSNEQFPIAVLPLNHDINGTTEFPNEGEESVDSKDLIKQLLQPKELPKFDISPQDRIVKGLKVELLDHQVIGLEFLLNREKVKPKQRTYLKDVYGVVENSRDETFFNIGGILADDMGLGKTVQMIALILRNRISKKKQDSSEPKTTLIVCPASLVSQWCIELESKSPSLTVLSYHGTKRPSQSEIVHNFDVVVTSYQTLSSEENKSSSPLYDPEYPFRRLVLDEAHTIKNIETKAHKSCCNIVAKRRWCLTGTPLQNQINELYSLLKFLGVDRLEDQEIWRVKISSLLNSHKPNSISKALARLHTILDKFMLRRTKQILIDNKVLMVSKNIYIEKLDFTPLERHLYNKLEKRIIKNILGTEVNIDDITTAKIDQNRDKDLSYMGVFTYLLRLRQLCCHWELLFNFSQKHDEDSLMMEIKSGLSLDNSNEKIDKESLHKSLENEDLDDILDLMKDMTIDDKQSTKETSGEGNSEYILKEDINNSTNAIKIKRILNILKKDDKDKPRKTIIFSEFTSMLDILSSILFENKITYVRYDGTMDKTSKDLALKKLREDPKIHVLLCSLKSGAYGLNITCCSRVILYEPFWNPAIGAQAIDRVYRIGQIFNVDVHEFFVSDSIEMRIKELQDKKRQLMMAVVDKDATSAVKMLGKGLSKTELLGLLGIHVNQ